MPVRMIGTDDVPPYGGFRTRQATYTLATYSAAGTAAPVAGDIVTNSNGANDRVVLAPNDTANAMLGRVKSVNVADLTLLVEWFNVYAFVQLPCDDASTVTLGNAAIKDGDTTVLANFDAGAAVGNLIVVSKSGTSGAITFCAAVVIMGLQA